MTLTSWRFHSSVRVRQFLKRSDAGKYCRAKVDQRTGVCAIVDGVSKRILNWTQQKLTQVNSSEKGVSKIKLVHRICGRAMEPDPKLGFLER